jgi:Rad3-related DNA helicase
VTDQLDGGLRLSEALTAIAERLRRENPFRGAAPTRESRHYEKLVEWTARLADDARLVSVVNDEDSVRYVERGTGSRAAEVTLKWTPVSVGAPLAEMLFRQTPVICTSATLAVGDFSYFRHAVGIDEAVELVAPSPFDYARQCLLYVPPHLPEFRGGATPEYTAALCDEIDRLVRLSDGRAFLLFTSYRGMEDAYAALRTRLPYTLFKQGEAPRGELLRAFREDGAAVLFGTKSFWEGVDVVGDALSLVVIDRMPFSVPDDPVVQTRVERMKREGEDWFNGLMLPTAILQLKQGVGRLIRSRGDRGVVAILDSRLARRSYGVRVIRALPPARVARRLVEVERFFQEPASRDTA